jgi:hypothetical protein
VTQGFATILFTLGAVGWWTLFARTFRAREDLIASALAWVALVGAVWATLALLQTQSNDLATRTLLLRGTLFLGMVMPPAWWVLALRIAAPPWLRRWHLVAFARARRGRGRRHADDAGRRRLPRRGHRPRARRPPDPDWEPGPWLAYLGIPYAFALLALAAAVVVRTGATSDRLDRATASTLTAAMLLPRSRGGEARRARRPAGVRRHRPGARRVGAPDPRARLELAPARAPRDRVRGRLRGDPGTGAGRDERRHDPRGEPCGAGSPSGTTRSSDGRPCSRCRRSWRPRAVGRNARASAAC